MIAWILYCVVVSAVVAGAARAAESLARVASYRMRWIWIGALVLTAFLSVSWGIQRFEPRAPLAVASSTRVVVVPSAQADPTWLDVVRSATVRVSDAIDGALSSLSGAIAQRVPASAIIYGTAAWLVVSLGLATAFAVVVQRFRRARRGWPQRRVHDVPVRVSPNVGPIVIGIVRPEIVVPRWLLHRADDEQRLAVAHEHEHLRARDPLLLGIGWTIVILAPWNPALWYMISRLRLAIELDCDARVLRGGVTPRAYGSLLIEVAQHASPLTLSALGFADESSQLYHRILALRAPTASFVRTRAVLAMLAAMGGVLVACRITPPQASTAVAQIAPRQDPSPAAQEDKAAPAQDDKPAQPRRRRTAVATASVNAPAAAPELASAPIVAQLDSVARRTEPMILIDGVRSTTEEMRAIDPKKIENVEVLKGTAAIHAYGADAEHGVITISTKPTSPPPL
jgi:beta-lactamase regulating signal transducer with metallopeptidase domain